MAPAARDNSRRGGEIAAARCLAAHLARRYGRISVRRVARRLGRDDSTFTRPLALLERRVASESALRQRIDGLVELPRHPDGNPSQR